MSFINKADLKLRVEQLEAAIRKHRDWKGDDRCFMDDDELYAVLPDYKPAETQLPPKEHFLKSCERFWECRQKKEEHLWEKTPPLPEWRTLAPEIIAYLKSLSDTLGFVDTEEYAGALVLLGKIEALAQNEWVMQSDEMLYGTTKGTITSSRVITYKKE